MTSEEKLNLTKTFLDADDSLDEMLSAYLTAAGKEIIEWLYSLTKVPDDVTEVPSKYEMTQIQAVVVGYSMKGAEGETNHSENGITRNFRYADMLNYIHRNVTPYARVI